MESNGYEKYWVSKKYFPCEVLRLKCKHSSTYVGFHNSVKQLLLQHRIH